MRVSVGPLGVGSLGVRSLAVIVIALASHACGSNAAPPAASSSTPAASATPASTPASTSGSAEFGVPECDDYMKKYLACIDKLAPSAQAQARQALDQSREAWKQAASTEVGKSALASTCKSASDAAAPAMRAQGCTW